jgi:hypothetical protein
MGGSMHIFSKEHRFYGGHGIVGQIPVGAGLAFADKYFETNAVTLTYFVMVQLAKALCTKPLTWQCYGNYQSFYR